MNAERTNIKRRSETFKAHCYFQGVKITPLLLLFGGVKILRLV
jgi:hypothetical protein